MALASQRRWNARMAIETAVIAVYQVVSVATRPASSAWAAPRLGAAAPTPRAVRARASSARAPVVGNAGRAPRRRRPARIGVVRSAGIGGVFEPPPMPPKPNRVPGLDARAARSRSPATPYQRVASRATAQVVQPCGSVDAARGEVADGVDAAAVRQRTRGGAGRRPDREPCRPPTVAIIAASAAGAATDDA